MKLLRENQRDYVFELDEAIVFILYLMNNEIDHDPELVSKAKLHVQSLVKLHAIITEEEPVV